MPQYLAKLVFRLTVGDHTGYCSDSECEDTITYKTIYVKIETDSEVPEFIELSYEQKEKIINLMKRSLFTDIIDNINFRGSGYCKRSESGLQHEYQIELVLFDIQNEKKNIVSEAKLETFIREMF